MSINNEAFERARIESGLNQAELAAAAGVPQGTISRLERGADPRLSTARRVARALNRSVEDVFYGEHAPPPRGHSKRSGVVRAATGKGSPKRETKKGKAA